jgi:AraC family transcriptional regulator
MLTMMQADGAWIDLQDTPREQEASRFTQAFHRERNWRQFEHSGGPAIDDIAVSRWRDPQNACRREEAIAPPDGYSIGIALKATRLKLTRGRKAIFDGIMPAGTLYISASSKQLSAQFHGPYDFLHLHVSANYFPSQRSATQLTAAQGPNDLVLLRDPFAEQIAKVLTEHGDTCDEKFACCVGQTLAMHLARLELPRTRVNSLPKWRLQRVEEYVEAHLGNGIGLSDLAKVAGLSRMYFAAQFRIATGFRPHEYLLHQRIKSAKSLLSDTKTPLVEVALAVGFCSQAHFSTVFKRITSETPARWRRASKHELPLVRRLPQEPTSDRRGRDLCRVGSPT